MTSPETVHSRRPLLRRCTEETIFHPSGGCTPEWPDYLLGRGQPLRIILSIGHIESSEDFST